MLTGLPGAGSTHPRRWSRLKSQNWLLGRRAVVKGVPGSGALMGGANCKMLEDTGLVEDLRGAEMPERGDRLLRLREDVVFRSCGTRRSHRDSEAMGRIVSAAGV